MGLDMHLYKVKRKDIINEHDFRHDCEYDENEKFTYTNHENYQEEIRYWRKNWFLNNIILDSYDGDDIGDGNVSYHFISKELLEKIILELKTVRELSIDEINEKYDSCNGYFSNPAIWYDLEEGYESLDEEIKFFEDIIKIYDDGNESEYVLYYYPWW